MLEKIVAERCDSYDVKVLKNLFYGAFREIGFTVAHQKILIKPNLLSGKPPEKGVTTHPEFVRAISELLLDFSCSVYIGDSPGYESTERVLSKSGIMDVVKDHGLSVASFNKKVVKSLRGISPYKKFVLGENPDDFDVIINLPKLKTHMMMGLTLGVKNTFGFIHAMDKTKWHLRAGRDRMIFASVLVDVYNIVKPSITIIDGVIGMDKDGPGSGRVKPMGVVALGKNAFALDRYIEKLVGVPFLLPISSKAEKHGMMPDYQAISLDHPPPVIDDFQMPATMDTDWNLPGLAKRALRSIFIKKPKLKKSICKGCGVCVTVCPAIALFIDERTPTFNYDRCIRCYCCQEMCPEGAIRV